MRDAHGVAGFKKLQRRFAVDAKDGVFNFGVGGGIDAAAEKFVAGINVFDFAESGGGDRRFLEHGEDPVGGRKSMVGRGQVYLRVVGGGWRLTERGSGQHSQDSRCDKKSRCQFHVMLLIAMEGGRITMAVRRPQSIKKIDAPRNNERSKTSWAGYVVSYLQASRERGVERGFGKGFA